MVLVTAETVDISKEFMDEAQHGAFDTGLVGGGLADRVDVSAIVVDIVAVTTLGSIAVDVGIISFLGVIVDGQHLTMDDIKGCLTAGAIIKL